MTRALSSIFNVDDFTSELLNQFDNEIAQIFQEEIDREFREEVRRRTIEEFGFYEFVLKAEFLKERAIDSLGLIWSEGFIQYAEMVEIFAKADAAKALESQKS